MKPVKIVGIGNYDEINYLKLKVEKDIIKKLILFLYSFLGQNYILTEDNPNEEEQKFYNYKTWIDKHIHDEKEGYKLDLIFGKDYVHLILNCSLRKRQDFFKHIRKNSEWIKPKIKQIKEVI